MSLSEFISTFPVKIIFISASFSMSFTLLSIFSSTSKVVKVSVMSTLTSYRCLPANGMNFDVILFSSSSTSSETNPFSPHSSNPLPSKHPE